MIALFSTYAEWSMCKSDHYDMNLEADLTRIHGYGHYMPGLKRETTKWTTLQNGLPGENSKWTTFLKFLLKGSLF